MNGFTNIETLRNTLALDIDNAKYAGILLFRIWKPRSTFTMEGRAMVTGTSLWISMARR